MMKWTRPTEKEPKCCRWTSTCFRWYEFYYPPPPSKKKKTLLVAKAFCCPINKQYGVVTVLARTVQELIYGKGKMPRDILKKSTTTPDKNTERPQKSYMNTCHQYQLSKHPCYRRLAWGQGSPSYVISCIFSAYPIILWSTTMMETTV